jgi:hypothetical protein
MRHPAIALATAAVLAGCGTGTSRPPTTGEPAPEPEAYTDLPGYEGDPFSGFSGVVSIDLPAPAERPEEGRPPEGEDRPSSGPFSIQVMALGDEATARGVAESASGESGMAAFVDHEGGWWKVRLGSFEDRASAAAALSEVVDLGFTDAWVVRRDNG